MENKYNYGKLLLKKQEGEYMKEKFLILIIAIFSTVLYSCGDTIYMGIVNYSLLPLYENDENIYFRVSHTSMYSDDNLERGHNVAIYDKLTNEISSHNNTEIKSVSNYNTMYTYPWTIEKIGEYNNPIVYSYNHGYFVDIQTGERFIVDEACESIEYSYSDCNIVDIGYQVLVDRKGDANYTLNISNYVDNSTSTEYSFTIDKEYEDYIMKIETFSRYNNSKLGIRINFYETKNLYDTGYISSLIFEYDLLSDTIVKLFSGPEFQYFKFEMSNNSYIFYNDTSSLHEYNIDTGELTLHHVTNQHYNLNTDYFVSLGTNGAYLVKYTKDGDSKYISDFSTDGMPKYILKGNLYLELLPSGISGYEYRISNLLTGEVLFSCVNSEPEWLEKLLDSPS